MDWIQQWQSKLNKQNGVAPLVRTGGSRHTGLAALPYRNIQHNFQIIEESYQLQRNNIPHQPMYLLPGCNRVDFPHVCCDFFSGGSR